MIAKIYFGILPVFLVLGALFQGIRISGSFERFAPIYFGAWQLFDILLLLYIKPHISKRTVCIFLLLSFSLILGLSNYKFNRHTASDFANPLIFFLKIDIMISIIKSAKYDILRYIRYFVKTVVLLCIPTLFYTLYIIYSAGRSRIAIAPPLEIPFSYCLSLLRLKESVFVFIGIVAFGQRACLIGGFFSFLFSLFYYSFASKVKAVIIILCTVFIIISYFGENPTIQRFLNTFKTSFDDIEEVNKTSAGRLEEIECGLDTLKHWGEYVVGKGCGMYFELNYREEVSYQVHFSPLCFLLKYGIVFTFLTYYYLFRGVYLGLRKKQNDNKDMSVIMKTITLSLASYLIESIFSYMLLTSIVPFLLAYIFYYSLEHANAPETLYKELT